MSTYYCFACKKCKVTGGFFSRQAWGWGNFEIIKSFKFIAYHVGKCGHENIEILSEYDDESDLILPSEDFYEQESQHIFPHSDDWETNEQQFIKYKEHLKKLKGD